MVPSAGRSPVPGLLVLLLCTAGGARAQDGVATDRAALQALYDATNGAHWTDDANWSSGEALASWHGVTTDGDGRVTRLELGANGLNGTLPAALGRLARLEALLLDGNVYLAGPLPAGLRELPALATVDLTDTELCAPEDAAFQDWTATISFSGLICPPAEQSVIDVAVFYTPAARDQAGGTAAIETRIDLMAAETNQAYRASGVNQRIVLAAVEEVDPGEDLGSFDDRLQDPSDGHMDEVHTIRDQVAADLVLLIISGTFGLGGRAYEILTPENASAANAFAWMRLGRGTLTFAHELGHLMGLAHDRWSACGIGQPFADEGCSPAATAYGFGYVNQRAFDAGALTAARWRTIMAFGGQCNNEGRRFRCHELLRFSNPDQIHPDPGGDPLGVSGREPSTAVDGPADAVLTLNRTRATVANFRTPSAVTVSFGAAAYTAAEGGEAATVTVNLSPAPGRPVSIPLLSVGATGATASDYTAPGSVAFAATETAQTFTVTAVDDDAEDDGETVALEFDTSLLPSGMTVGNPATATVTLDDDDAVAGAPSVSMVALTSDPGPDAIYALGDEIEATVRFDKSVTVTGTPQLGLTVGSHVRPATHSGGAGDVLTFSYQVVEGDSDTDGVSIAADSLSGTIRDSANLAAGLTHAEVEDDAGHRVDAVRPLLQGAVVDGKVLDLTYDEALLGNLSTTEAQFHAPDAFTVTNGDDTPPVVERLSALNGPELTLVLSRPVIHGQEVTVSYTPGAWSIRDAAGTAAVAFADRSATNETSMPFYDTDHDGLIEITTLAQLDVIRHDLYGDGFPTGTGAAAYRAAFPLAFPDPHSRLRCGGECLGYELLADLDFFDINGDGQVDTNDDTNGDGRVAADDTPYWTNGAGWEPIATGSSPWSATFEGNGHTIRHLFINRPAADQVGLFGLVRSSFGTGSIRAVGVIEVDVTGNDCVGGLVGENRGGVTASYATGRVSGNSEVGGLVGENRGGVTASYATGRVSGDSGVGGLVGENRGGVTASYATGRVSGDSEVGGLVGENRGDVTASYATSPVSGNRDVGGLVGWNSSLSTISVSYWDTTTSGQTASDGGAGQSTEVLQAPTGYSGIYVDWEVDLDGDGTADDAWHFGTSDQYPVLKADLDGDGTATWQEFGHQLRAGPTLTATADGRPVALIWTAVDTSAWVLPPEVTYTVTRDDGTTTTVIDEASSGLTAGDTVVPVGVTHTYQVAAVVDGGEAVRSATVAVTGVPPNRPPVPQGTLPARTLPIGGVAVAVDVSGAFQDPDGDPLTYAASSSAPLVAAASAAGSVVTVTPLAAGVATITVTATDAGGSGMSATQTFVVTVPNRPPEAARPLADRSVEVSDGVSMVDVSLAFQDPDGDPLTYGASSSAPSVATVTAAGSVVSVTPLSGGTATVTVTATDRSGSNMSAMQAFTVTVANRSPVAAGTLSPLSLRVSTGAQSVEVSDAFSDPDGDALTYGASSSDDSVATVAVSGSTVEVTPVSGGTATVTVTAEDAGGLRAEQAFEVTVANRSPERVGSLPALELQTAAGAVAVEVSGAFRDPDDDVLTYGATSSAVTVAAVVASDSTVTVTPLSRGTATVTVTATDVAGSNTSAAQAFGVRVDGGGGPGPGPGGPPGGGRNRAPQAVGTLADRTLEPGARPLPVEVSDAFRDRDGDVLTYAADSSAAEVAAVSVSGGVVSVTALSVGEAEVTVTATDAEGSNRSAAQSFAVTVSHDADGDGLIGVHTLAQLDAVRHDVDGDGEPAAAGAAGYAAAFGATDSGAGTVRCRAAGGCRGYELGSDLDLDTNGSGGADAGNAWWNGGAGWLPLGTLEAPFTTTFEGNGRRIRGLFVRGGDGAGLFGATGSSSVIRGVGVTAVDVTGGTAVGGLVGANGGTVTGSHATGRVSGAEAVGGLVGRNTGDGVVVGSYAAVEASGDTAVGGLVGANAGGVAAVHATGRVSGTRRVGGLVGYNRGALAAGYATGRVFGAAESGGLAGLTQPPGTVTASYWDTDTSGLPADASGGAAGTAGRGQSTSALQAAAGYAGLYAAWDVDVDGDDVADAPWDFGTDRQYPALSLDVDGDGVAGWREVGRQLRAGPALTAALAVDPVQVDLTWTAVAVGAWTPSPEVSYTVTRETGAGVETMATDVRGLRYADRGVEPGSAYTYQVAAVVAGGEAARSALAAVQVPCAYTVTPLRQDLLWTAGTGEVRVSTGPACAWTAASESEDFLTVTSGVAGTGSGTATWAVEANGGGPREGTLLVAGRRVTVYQASPTVFTDHPIEPGVTPVRAIHFLELRARVDALRTGAGLPAFGWTDPTLTPGVTPVERVHLTELRRALSEAYAAAGRAAPAYRDVLVAGGTVIGAAQMMELRAAVRALEAGRPPT